LRSRSRRAPDTHGAGGNATAISPIALEAVKRIDALFDIERDINGLSAEERLRVRKEQSR
jgi:transposase